MDKVILIEGINGGGGDVVYLKSFKGVHPTPEGDLHIDGPKGLVGTKLTVANSPNAPLIPTNIEKHVGFVRERGSTKIMYRVSLINKEKK